MAWLDDSPVCNAESKEQGVSAFTAGFLFINNKGKLPFIYRLPVVKDAVLLFKNYFLSRKLYASNLGEMENVTALLRDLMNIKTISNRSLAFFKDRIIKQIDTSIQFLVKKSYALLDEVKSIETKIVTFTETTHQSILARLQPSVTKTEEKTAAPTRVYWRNTEPSEAYSLRIGLKQNFSPIYLHSWCQHKLLQALVTPENVAKLQQSGEIRISNKIYEPEWNSKLVCGFNFQLTPKFNVNTENKGKLSSFWQHQNTVIENVLSNIGTCLKDYITELFFQTTTDYEAFKELLTKNKNQELLELIFKLEVEKQISIQQTPSMTLS